MTNIIIGNIIALIASLLMVYTGFIKTRKKILLIQTIQILFFTISNLVLGGFTGAISNFLSIIRNILSYKDKLGLKEKIIITVLTVSLSLLVNNMGLIGILPLISSVAYIWLMDIKDIIKFKNLIIFSSLMWLIYDIIIYSYASVIFDIANILSNFISIYLIKNEKNIKNNKHHLIKW